MGYVLRNKRELNELEKVKGMQKSNRAYSSNFFYLPPSHFLVLIVTGILSSVLFLFVKLRVFFPRG
jgi:hypothetical protein